MFQRRFHRKKKKLITGHNPEIRRRAVLPRKQKLSVNDEYDEHRWEVTVRAGEPGQYLDDRAWIEQIENREFESDFGGRDQETQFDKWLKIDWCIGIRWRGPAKRLPAANGWSEKADWSNDEIGSLNEWWWFDEQSRGMLESTCKKALESGEWT